MRKLSIFLLLIFCSQYLLAQLQPEIKLNPKNLNKYFRQEKPKEFTAGHWPLKPIAIINQSDTARFSHTIAQGNIYRLPIDNMPCLRPDTSAYENDQAKMVLVLPLNATIPNAFKGKQLVWEKRP